MKILIMECSKEVADSIAGNLSGLGYQYDFVRTLDALKHNLKGGGYDCVVLDTSTLGDFNTGFIEELRTISKHVGLIVTSGKDSFREKINALNTGADDYLARPFEPSELAVRILALCRRTAVYNRDILVYKEIKVDMQAKMVTVNGAPINLTKKELELLLYFLDHKNSVIKKDNLITFLSGQLHEFKSNADIIYAHIKNLKKKMSDAGCTMYLKTVYGIGYKWEE
ncbi:response regulator transcription factor [Dyadobacter sp. LHD-138]|uniref:response regulator transcription factor n=1 Tax=Dyadobacter sp. LHD-138 TaxID=3071413 RepID=UPI0027E1CD13|nr:response regulator transcription factor [Dyadobacter sp. LHD-138]MDQ6478093.1 response regulator transcription factor [Dyadobacter sp. LHD-138]